MAGELKLSNRTQPSLSSLALVSSPQLPWSPILKPGTLHVSSRQKKKSRDPYIYVYTIPSSHNGVSSRNPFSCSSANTGYSITTSLPFSLASLLLLLSRLARICFKNASVLGSLFAHLSARTDGMDSVLAVRSCTDMIEVALEGVDSEEVFLLAQSLRSSVHVLLRPDEEVEVEVEVHDSDVSNGFVGVLRAARRSTIAPALLCLRSAGNEILGKDRRRASRVRLAEHMSGLMYAMSSSSDTEGLEPQETGVPGCTSMLHHLPGRESSSVATPMEPRGDMAREPRSRPRMLFVGVGLPNGKPSVVSAALLESTRWRFTELVGDVGKDSGSAWEMEVRGLI